jgi:hypothetical protein
MDGRVDPKSLVFSGRYVLQMLLNKRVGYQHHPSHACHRATINLNGTHRT